MDGLGSRGLIFQGGSRQVGNEIDEFVTDVLRNQLLGRPLDLATLNLARGRSEGVPGLNEVRRQLFNRYGHSSLTPYDNWDDFGVALRNFPSLVNFIAAYGTHPMITTVPARPASRPALVPAVAAGDALVNGTRIDPGPDGILGDDPPRTRIGAPGRRERRRHPADPRRPGPPAQPAGPRRDGRRPQHVRRRR